MNSKTLTQQLDYTLYSDVERAAFVTQLLATNNWEEYLLEQLSKGLTDNSPAAKQLELLGNYIMYGKNPQGKNALERKEVIRPTTRYTTFAPKTPLSLDELTDTPTFSEQTLRPVERNSYLTPKRQIVRPAYAQDVATGELFCLNEHEHDAHIAGMAELWRSIDYLEWLVGKQNRPALPLSARTYLVAGRAVFKVNFPVVYEAGKLTIDMSVPPTPPKLSPITLYRLKHWLIDQKRHQYYLKESANPTAFAQHFSFTPPFPIDWEQDSAYWLTRREATLLRKDTDPTRWRWRAVTAHTYTQYCADDPEEVGYYFGPQTLLPEQFSQLVTPGLAPIAARSAQFVKEYYYLVAQHTLDFTNPLHVYALLENYRSLRIWSYDKLNGQLRHILAAFSHIIDRTELYESRDIILYYKIHKWTNERIARELLDFGYTYATNYISTIYKREICVKIARQARIMDEEWSARHQREAWRRCKECGRNKLATTDNFTSKPKNYGGLSYRCKACDKIIREKRRNPNGKGTLSLL